MAIQHAASGELIDISPLAEKLENHITKTLYKSAHLEIFRMVLLAGKVMAAHRVAGEITVQCIEGQVEFTSPRGVVLLRKGSLVCLAGGEMHSLKAIEDSSVLVTLLFTK